MSPRRRRITLDPKRIVQFAGGVIVFLAFLATVVLAFAILGGGL